MPFGRSELSLTSCCLYFKKFQHLLLLNLWSPKNLDVCFLDYVFFTCYYQLTKKHQLWLCTEVSDQNFVDQEAEEQEKLSITCRKKKAKVAATNEPSFKDQVACQLCLLLFLWKETLNFTWYQTYYLLFWLISGSSTGEVTSVVYLWRESFSFELRRSSV